MYINRVVAFKRERALKVVPLKPFNAEVCAHCRLFSKLNPFSDRFDFMALRILR